MFKELSKKRVKRSYSEDFKKEAVLTYEASDKSLAEICRLLDITNESILRRWIVLYGKQSSKREPMKSLKKDTQTASCKSGISPSKPEDAARILALEEEIKHLRQVLGTHAVKEYLAELREESWREVTNSETAKEVERMVAKKR